MQIQLAKGIFLKATSLLNDTYFEGAIIYIIEYNQQGAMGFVINSPFHRKFNELLEFLDCPPYTLYEGGPVGVDNLYFLHKKPKLIKGGELVADNVYYGGDFSMTVQLMYMKTINESEFRLYIGYCGWESGQLESEIEEGSWEEYKDYQLFN